MLDNRPEREGWEVDQAADDQNDADQQADEEATRSRECARRGRNELLTHERTRYSQHRNDEEEASHQYGETDRQIVKEGVGAETGEGAPIVPGALGISV